MTAHHSALFDAFSDTALGGSVAGIVADAGDLDAGRMQRIARELGAPATAFITGMEGSCVDVRFFSTLTEYPMCGHGTVGLMTWLVERGELALDGGRAATVTLRTPAGPAPVEVRRREDGRVVVMLSLDAVDFEPSPLGIAEIAPMLGVSGDAFAANPPVELTRSEFTHVVARVAGLDAMRALKPDFGVIAERCRQLGVHTLALFTTETERPESSIHCREFCPAVGTPEAPASGTTNRALACYLLRHALIDPSPDGARTVIAEQGCEIGRPSLIRTELTVVKGRATGIRTGGVATKSMEGTLYVD